MLLFALDYNDNRVHIDDTHSNQEYYCPYCGAPLITRKGDIRQHHFAHKQNFICSDSWERSRSYSYDISPWHFEWQSHFPKDNQEVKLSLGDTTHRADVMIDRTVVEFQNSLMSVQAFDDRNNFYYNLGDKVIWLFNLTDLFSSGQLSCQEAKDSLNFEWEKPKKAFNNHDIKNGHIDLFFQLKDDSDECIVRVTDVSEYGFESFETSRFISKNDFLAYVGMRNGTCLPPFRDDIEKNQQYKEFKEKYNIALNKQQERALLAVEGANLLLAVPGSGKTTVLVSRLGHMVINKNIPPESILAITFGNNSGNEMRQRFSAKFGQDLGDRIDFRTINSLSLKIYTDYCDRTGTPKRKQIQSSEKRILLKNIYQKHNGKDSTENEYLELAAAISYIKNMRLKKEQICEMETELPHLNAMYESYEKALKDKQRMDYDDQMVYAYALLTKREQVAREWQAKYKYICVDEAQDTLKIQHEIIKILAKGNNVFMVGDEDQSIYGFRAAYPKALLNFRYDYMNPYILRMERNYRSTPQIVEKAQSFISQNKGRYEKNMTAERDDGEAVILEQVESREAQFMRLLEIAKTTIKETAFLYRDNESAVVLVDLFLRNNIPFKLRKPEMNFFGTRMVKAVVEKLSLVKNEKDTDSFSQLSKIRSSRQFDNGKTEILSLLAKQEPNIQKFLSRLTELEKMMQQGFDSEDSNAIVLSTIHSSKGLEYDTVYMVDVYDGRFPSSRPNIFSRSKDNADGEQEERRLFYVGITRAKNHLTLFYLKDQTSRFIDELFPEEKAQRLEEEDRLRREEYLKERQKAAELREQRRIEILRQQEEQNRIYREQLLKEQEEKRKEQEQKRQEREKAREADRIRQQQIAERYYTKGYDEVKDKFIQQHTQIRDSFGVRWIKCEICGEIKPASEFGDYSGPNRVNLGKCYKCTNGK